MKQNTKLIIGLLVWFGFGLASMISLGWQHIVTWVIGTYLYIIFVEPYLEEEKKKSRH